MLCARFCALQRAYIQETLSDIALSQTVSSAPISPVYEPLLLTDDALSLESDCRSLDRSKRAVRSCANLFFVVHGNKLGTASGLSCLRIDGTPKTPEPPIFSYNCPTVYTTTGLVH